MSLFPSSLQARRQTLARMLSGAAVLALPLDALARDKATPPANPAPRVQTDWGIAGQSSAVGRRVSIRMLDRLRFEPSHLSIRLGETLKIAIVNTGVVMHELAIGTPEALAEHADLMRRYPDMAHEEAHVIHIPPGRRGTLVWHFNREGAFGFACLVPGHFDAGMRGTILVHA